MWLFQEPGFGAFNGEPNPPEGHVHDSLEISAFDGGRVTMLYGSHAVEVAPGRLIVHWGMLPHQMLSREPRARVIGVHIPMSWFLNWELPPATLAHLLGLREWIEPAGRQPRKELALLRDWWNLLRSKHPHAREIVLAEAHARLLRLDVSRGDVCTNRVLYPDAIRFGRVLQTVARHFQEPLRMHDLARKAGVSERHLSRLFQQYTGQTVHGYLTTLRLSYAQRLLMTSSGKVLDIMLESGFSCQTRFYELFKAQTCVTPAKFRNAARNTGIR